MLRLVKLCTNLPFISVGARLSLCGTILLSLVTEVLNEAALQFLAENTELNELPNKRRRAESNGIFSSVIGNTQKESRISYFIWLACLVAQALVEIKC